MDSGILLLLTYGLDMDVLYNIADAINKIGFGLVIYSFSS